VRWECCRHRMEIDLRVEPEGVNDVSELHKIPELVQRLREAREGGDRVAGYRRDRRAGESSGRRKASPELAESP